MMENIRVEKNLALKDIRKLAVSEKYASIASRLKTVPGVGTITAITLITEIEDMNRFKCFEKITHYYIIQNKSRR
ncbi:MAG: transposase [Saprospiraceae bacterium]|nr:transposase [Candidatus Vicinibacter affinis]